MCECNIAEIILKLKAMKRLKKLSLLSNEQLAKIKGGVVEDFGDVSLLRANLNDRRNCYCSGLGDNTNKANKCDCTNGPCGGSLLILQLQYSLTLEGISSMIFLPNLRL